MLIPIVVAILVTLAVVAPITWFISGKAIAKSNDENGVVQAIKNYVL